MPFLGHRACAESVCSQLQSDDEDLDAWLLDDNNCYVIYPQAEQELRRSWYEARNKCILLGGDLATASVIAAARETNLLRLNEKYWIGLQRDPLMMPLTGT